MKKFLHSDVPISVKGAFLSALFTFAAGVSAFPAYAQSIVTDRVWLVDLDVTQTTSFAAKFTFDGACESNGNVYDCLTLTELYNYHHGDVFGLVDGDKGITFNLREADGIVYMQTPRGGISEISVERKSAMSCSFSISMPAPEIRTSPSVRRVTWR